MYNNVRVTSEILSLKKKHLSVSLWTVGAFVLDDRCTSGVCVGCV